MIYRAILFPAIALLAGCATTTATTTSAPIAASAPAADAAQYQADRDAILAMVGNFSVTFDFIETVSFDKDYELNDRAKSGGDEIVRIIQDDGDFISLQHTLVVGGKDAPRYGAVGAWKHENGVSSWEPSEEWRPLPRRDATKRTDYHAVDAINIHTITPAGWVHEQINTKLVLSGEPHALVREIGVNTYTRNDDFEVAVGDDYWTATKDFWAEIRDEWTRIETENPRFGLTIQGEPEDLYMKILDLAEPVEKGEKTSAAAAAEARIIIGDFTTTDIGALQSRIEATASGDEY